MDKNQKFLKKLSKKELAAVVVVLTKLKKRNIDNLDVKKLTGYKDVYRVRMGNLRIIFLDQADGIKVLEIARRSDNTYNKF